MTLNFIATAKRPFLLHCCMLVAAVFFLAGCERPAAFRATDITGASFGRLATLEALSDHTGKRVAGVDFSGRAVVVFFGYTQCPDICPTTLLAMQETMRLLGADADRVQVLFVTLDPERDTPEILAPYVTWFDKRFRALRGDAQATLDAARDFRVFYSKVPRPDGSYSLDHTATSYVFDPQGRIRLLLRHGETPENIAADLRLLLAGK